MSDIKEVFLKIFYKQSKTPALGKITGFRAALI